MKQIAGIAMIVLGVTCAAWCGLVGGGFSCVYLMGYIGTNGNEAGRELAWMSSFTVAGIVLGVLITRLGMWLRNSSATRA